jgi:hypothetical protein
MAHFNATNTYSNSRYIVDNVTAGSPFTTVQAAINAAVADGGSAIIWIRQGTYNENLTLYDGINIEGQEQSVSIIIGKHTPPAAGSVRFTRVGLRSGTHIFDSNAAGTTLLSCLRCQFLLTNGYVYNLPNWTGELRLRWCTDYSTANGLVNNAGGSIVTMNHSLIGIGANVFTANGNVSIFSCDVACPFLLNGTGVSIFYGGSNFGNNIATANTHLLRVALSRISSGATQAITHNSASTLVLDTAVVGTSNATAIGGTGAIKMVNVQFPNSNVLAGTITTTLDGVTRTAEMWADNIARMDDTGFYSWAAAAPYFDDTTLGTFQLLVGGTGYIRNKKVTWVAQNIAGMTAGNTYWIYIDATGTIGKTAARTETLFMDNIVLFECLRDSTLVNNQVTVKENHPYDYQVSVSNYQHDTIGTVIENSNNGANITLSGTQKIAIAGDDAYSDHGLYTDIADTGGVGATWIKYFTNAGGKWARQNATDTFTGYWNNAGTATALTAGKFGVYRLYVSKDSLNVATPTYFAVLHTAEFNTAGAAQTAISNGSIVGATNELSSLELAQLGYIIYRQSTATIVQVIISKATARSTITTAGASVASLVTTNVTNFDGILSATDTNVQTALETIDEFGKNLTDHCVVVGNGNGLPLGVVAAGATAQVLKGNTGADPSWGAVDLTTDVSGFLPVGSGGSGVGTLTDHGVLVGSGVNAITPLAVGATGTLLVGATGADPAFATSAAGNFTFTNAVAATPLFFSVENNDTDPGSYACVSVSAEPAGGDAYIFFEIDSATQYYSMGVDNSVAGDPWKLTNNVNPSTGDAIISSTNTGVLTLFNDLDVTEGGTGVSTLTSHGILMGNGAGDINATAEPTDGQLLIGRTGNFPALATLTSGVGVAITNAAGSITISAAGGGLAWAAVTVDAGLAVNTGTIANKAGLLTMTLPATAALGDTLAFTGINTAVGLRIAQNANQQIFFGTSATTLGVGGYLESTAIRDSVELTCVVAGASTIYNARNSIGNWTIV